MHNPDTVIATDREEVVERYEAPRVESVVTADEVEREANYGGISMQP